MKKEDLIRQVHEKVDLKKKEISLIIDVFFGCLVDALESGQKVDIKGLGSFKREIKKSKILYSPIVKKNIVVPEKSVLTFIPSKSTEIIKKGV